MGKYKRSDYTHRGKHGKGQAPNSVTFDRIALNRNYPIKYKKRDRGYLNQDIDKSRSRQKFFQSALWTRNNQRKRHSSHSHNREQGSRRKRRRNSSASPLRVSPEKIPDRYSDISDDDLESIPGEISESRSRLDQRSTIDEDHWRQETYMQWKTSAHGQGNGIVNGQSIYRRYTDRYSSLSSDTHDTRLPETGDYKEEIFPSPITLHCFEAFSCRKKTEFIATALAELVALKTGNDYLSGVEMSDFRKRLHSRGIHFESQKSYMEIMSSLRANFDITNDEMIQPRTDVKICEHYRQNSRLEDCDCHDLHICKFNLVGKCFSGQKCKFSHDLFQPHNKDVLKRHYLHKMNQENIYEIVSYVHNRNATTSPTVCKFYNNEGGCKRQRCQHLHVCRHFVTKTCKFGGTCKRDHGFRSGQSKRILKNYGLSKYECDLEILFNLIGKNLNNVEIKTRKSLDKTFERTYDKSFDGRSRTSGNTQEVKTVFKMPVTYLQPKDEEQTKSLKSGQKLKSKQGGMKNISTKAFHLDKNISEKKTDPADVSSSIDLSCAVLSLTRATNDQCDSGLHDGSTVEVDMLQTHFKKENDSEVKTLFTTDDLNKQLARPCGNIQENTSGRMEKKQSETVLGKSNIDENTTDDNHEEMPTAIGHLLLQEKPPLMETVDKVDEILDNCQGNLQQKPLGSDGYKNNDNKPLLLEPSGVEGIEEHNKLSISLIVQDNYSREKSEQTSEDTKPDGKITFQRSPNHRDASVEQGISVESAEEGEIIEDTHTENSREPYQYSHLERETKHGTSAILVLTYGASKIENEKYSTNLKEEPCVMDEASIRNIYLSDVLTPTFKTQHVCQPKKLSDQRSSEALRQTDTGNHKSIDVAVKTYKILLVGNTVDITVLGETEKAVLNDDIRNKVKRWVTSLIQIFQKLDNTGPIDPVVSDGGHNVDD